MFCEHGGKIKPSLSCILKNTFCCFSSYLTECFFLWVYLSTSPTTFDFPRHFTLNTSKMELSLRSPHSSLAHEMPCQSPSCSCHKPGTFLLLMPLPCPQCSQQNHLHFEWTLPAAEFPRENPLLSAQCPRLCLTVSRVDCSPLFTSPITYSYLTPFI